MANKYKRIILRRLADLQPSQLYINREKLKVLQSRVDYTSPGNIPPIPIKCLGGKWVMTDGHTRAFAAYRAGLDKVQTVLDEDPLDWEAYSICVKWCREAGITEISDLENRVIDADSYERLWIARCRLMHEGLAERRKSTSH